jgi:hypothetical protein
MFRFDSLLWKVRSDLVDAGNNIQNDVFSYLFNFIKDADLFVSHPVKAFVPKMVSDHMPVVYMPPSTDPLDGLNKPLPESALESYRHYFNDIARASTGQQMDWQRGYILQVARFDPSKGIPDLVEGYRLFREKLKSENHEGQAPQLVMVRRIFVLIMNFASHKAHRLDIPAWMTLMPPSFSMNSRTPLAPINSRTSAATSLHFVLPLMV